MPTAPTYPFALPPALSAVWVWLQLCLGVLGMRGQTPERQDPSAAQPPSRSARKLYRHFVRLDEKGTRPAARNLAPFYIFGRRDITPTQFLERRCRLSCWGRVAIYRMVYWSPRLVREAVMAMFARGVFRGARGLWHVHIWPS